MTESCLPTMGDGFFEFLYNMALIKVLGRDLSIQGAERIRFFLRLVPGFAKMLENGENLGGRLRLRHRLV